MFPTDNQIDDLFFVRFFIAVNPKPMECGAFMFDPAKMHEEKYQQARAAGLPGWGGHDRISNLERKLTDRFFAYDKVPTSGRLLELGCGAGNLAIILGQKGFNVTGVDFSETAIKWANEKASLATAFTVS